MRPFAHILAQESFWDKRKKSLKKLNRRTRRVLRKAVKSQVGLSSVNRLTGKCKLVWLTG